MKTRQVPYSGRSAQQSLAALAQAFPADHLHVTDLPYRFRLLGAGRPRQCRPVEDEAGSFVGWAVMQMPFWAIDCACHPRRRAGGLSADVGLGRPPALVRALGGPSGRPAWFVNVFAGQSARIHALEAAGFACQANGGENSWSKVWNAAPDGAACARQCSARGIRHPPAGRASARVEAYVELQRAVFESKNMTAEWRARTLRRPEYIADLDWVAVAPDGRLAAFCIGWLGQCAGEVRGQIEPLGVRVEFRGLGLGRAILAETLRRLRAHGAAQVYVETDNYRNAALGSIRIGGLSRHPGCFGIPQGLWRIGQARQSPPALWPLPQ